MLTSLADIRQKNNALLADPHEQVGQVYRRLLGQVGAGSRHQIFWDSDSFFL
jgi:hypothetical protein